jgi:hypothetical protein
MKYSADGLVRFDEAKHTYWKGDKRLTGVTSLIKKYTEAFDAHAQAIKYCKKHGGDPYELMDKWEQKGFDSRVAGSAAHKVLEDYCDTGEITFMPNPPMKQVAAVKFIIDKFKTGRLIPKCWECLVHFNNTASMIDLVADTPNGDTYILDYKTSSKISKDGWGRYMKYPFEQLPDANFYHYSLQCSIYKKMFGGEIKDAYIVHIKETGYDLIKTEDIFVPDWIL